MSFMARPLRTPEKELRPDLAQYRRKVDLAWQRTTAGQSIAEHGPEVQRSATEHDTNCLNAKREEKRMPGTHELDTRSKLMKAHAPPRFAVKRIETGVSYRERCSRLVLRSALSIRRLGAQQKKKDTFVTPLWRYALTLYFFSFVWPSRLSTVGESTHSGRLVYPHTRISQAEGRVLTDRSVITALPLTTPRQVRKSSTNDSESRLRTEPLVYR